MALTIFKICIYKDSLPVLPAYHKRGIFNVIRVGGGKAAISTGL